MTVDRRAADGFTGGADAYRRARPTYPMAVVDEVVRVGGLAADARVLDLAAGTGKLTALLAAPDLGLEVVAVEPVAAMREILEETCPGVVALDGTAEAIPAADGTYDAVTVAQAFHWFDPATALREIHRVLRPGGLLALLWNTRDVRVPWVAAWDQLLIDATPTHPFLAYRDVDYGAVIAASPGFEPATCWTSDWTQPFDAELLVVRAASVSVVATLPERERDALLADVRRLALHHPDLAGAPTFDFPYVTTLWWARTEGSAEGSDEA